MRSLLVFRGSGADLQRHIGSQRAVIPDVPAIYLVEPTPANLQAITNDLQKGLYSSAHINFLSSIPRPLLEEFAAQTATTGTAESWNAKGAYLLGVKQCQDKR